MQCPFCEAQNSRVVDSRLIGEGGQIRRRRQCVACNERFTTFEVPELTLPMVIKSDQSREPFSESKLRHGMEMALEKRPVSTEAIDQVIDKIFHRVRTMGEREISSQTVGELVMDELRELDQVAYVRFASIYRSFEDVNAFREVIKRLEKESKSNESND